MSISDAPSPADKCSAPRWVDRVFQTLLIGSTLGFSWLMMMVVHEFGHMLHLWATGGSIAKVVLQPLDISTTIPISNPQPLVTVWGGAIWGSLLPLLFYGVIRAIDPELAYLPRFFAGFCLIANGGYLIAGTLGNAGDAAIMLLLGNPAWLLIAIGLPPFAAGLYLWHGLGPHFGLAAARGKVDRRAAVGMTAALVVLVVFELWLSPTY